MYFVLVYVTMMLVLQTYVFFFFSSRRRHTRCALVTGVQTCALPIYSEYYSVRQALKGLQAEPGIAKQDPAKIKNLFFRRLNISYSENVKPEHVTLQRRQDGPGWDMEVNYEVRKELVGNLDEIGRAHV